MPSIASLTPVTDLKDEDKVLLVDGGITKTTPLANLKYDFFNLQSNPGAVRDAMGSGGLTGTDKWVGGVLAPNGKIYGIPNSATSVLVIDPTKPNVYSYIDDAWYFNGTNNSVNFNAGVNGSGDFTFETWLNWDGSLGGNSLSAPLLSQYAIGFDSRRGGIFMTQTASGQANINIGLGSIVSISSPNGSILPNRWYHVAVVKQGSSSTNLKIYIDGQMVASGSMSIGFLSGIYTAIGHDSRYYSGDHSFFKGAMSNYRYVEGSAVYTSNFTPSPNSLTTITGTGITTPLLTFQDTTIINNGSGGSLTQVNTLTTSVQTIISVTGTGTTSTFGSTGGGRVGGVLAPNGKIYGIPMTATSVLVIDPTTNTTSTFGTTTGWSGGVLAPNGKIYGIPFNSTSVLVIDPATNTISTFGSLGTGDKWSGGVLAPNGKIYGIPYDSASVLVIDPATNTASTFGTSLGGGQSFANGALGANGKIYGVPFNASTILIIDPVSGTATTSTMGASLAGNGKYTGGTLSPNGKIYCVPGLGGSILIIDSVAQTATTSTMGATLPTSVYLYGGGVMASNGKIYGIPRSATDILQITPEFNPTSYVPLELCMSAYYN